MMESPKDLIVHTIPLLIYSVYRNSNLLYFNIFLAVAFQFSRIGDDKGAVELLQRLDDDKEVGMYVDCLPG